MKHSGRYAAIGYMVTKVGVPLAKRQAKKAARRKVAGAAGAIGRRPAKLGLAVGVAVGAVSWLVSRTRSRPSN